MLLFSLFSAGCVVWSFRSEGFEYAKARDVDGGGGLAGGAQPHSNPEHSVLSDVYVFGPSTTPRFRLLCLFPTVSLHLTTNFGSCSQIELHYTCDS